MLFTKDRLPHHPRCGNDKSAKSVQTIDKALQLKFIQPNPPGQIIWMVFDIDHPDAATRHRDQFNTDVPAPNFIVINPSSGHGQYWFCLAAPVNTGESGREIPKRWESYIYNGLGALFGADPCYTRGIARNPLHPEHLTILLQDEPWELAELDEYIGNRHSGGKWIARRRRAGREANIEGRNCTLFDNLRHWAYSIVSTYQTCAGFEQWQAVCLSQAEKMNDFPGHVGGNLSFNEVRGVAKSVAQWVWHNYEGRGGSDADFIEVQRARGRQKGQKMRDELLPRVVELAAAGWTQRAIASELNVPQKTVCRWLKRA